MCVWLYSIHLWDWLRLHNVDTLDSLNECMWCVYAFLLFSQVSNFVPWKKVSRANSGAIPTLTGIAAFPYLGNMKRKKLSTSDYNKIAILFWEVYLPSLVFSLSILIEAQTSHHQFHHRLYHIHQLPPLVSSLSKEPYHEALGVCAIDNDKVSAQIWMTSTRFEKQTYWRGEGRGPLSDFSSGMYSLSPSIDFNCMAITCW